MVSIGGISVGDAPGISGPDPFIEIRRKSAIIRNILNTHGHPKWNDSGLVNQIRLDVDANGYTWDQLREWCVGQGYAPVASGATVNRFTAETVLNALEDTLGAAGWAVAGQGGTPDVTALAAKVAAVKASIPVPSYAGAQDDVLAYDPREIDRAFANLDSALAALQVAGDQKARVTALNGMRGATEVINRHVRGESDFMGLDHNWYPPSQG